MKNRNAMIASAEMLKFEFIIVFIVGLTGSSDISSSESTNQQGLIESTAIITIFVFYYTILKTPIAFVSYIVLYIFS